MAMVDVVRVVHHIIIESAIFSQRLSIRYRSCSFHSCIFHSRVFHEFVHSSKLNRMNCHAVYICMPRQQHKHHQHRQRRNAGGRRGRFYLGENASCHGGTTARLSASDASVEWRKGGRRCCIVPS